MFNDVTTSYDLTDATWEIAIMLLVAFILGWLLHHFMHCRKSNHNENNNSVAAQRFIEEPVVTKAPVTDTTPAPLVSSPKPKPTSSQIDDLKVVEGIGPKIESLLHADGILTMRLLATVETSRVQKVLDAAGPRYRMHNPKTWSTQAELIADEKWDELKEYQDFLVGGREA